MLNAKMARVLGFALLTLVTPLTKANVGDDDLDAYKFRVDGVWWFSHPSGYFHGKNNEGYFDLNRDFGFGSYSTFSGTVDWRFKRKHHFLFGATPIQSSKTASLNRTITFQGQTFDVGASVTADIKSLGFAPGYQYDIIRRNHGFLGIAVQCDLLKTSADLSATGTVNGQNATTKASGSFFAPLPIFGPRARWYPLHYSSRFSLDGVVQGMYFFGYGDFVSANAAGTVAANGHMSVRAGYQMGSRLSIHGSSNTIGIRLTQKGPIAGIELNW